MSDRLLKILLGALAVLVIGYFVARLVSGDGGESASLDLASMSEGPLDSVIIAHDGDTIRLRRQDQRWTVNGVVAIRDAAASLERALDSARVGPLASRNHANHEALGVGDGEGRRATFYSDGAEPLTLVLGGWSSFDQANLRRAGADEVYRVRGALTNLVRRDANEWRNRELAVVDTADIRTLEYSYPDTTFSVVRDSAGWELRPSGTRVTDPAIARLFAQLQNLRAIGFAADSVTPTLDWEQPTGRLRIRGPGDQLLADLTFLVKGDQTGYYVRATDDPTVYTIHRGLGIQLLARPGMLAVDASE